MFGKKGLDKDTSPDINKKQTNPLSMFGEKFSRLKKKTEKIDNTVSSDIDEVSSGNIFDEFSSDDSLLSEVEKLKELQNKDLFYYLSIVGTIFQKLFIIIIFIILLGKGYIGLQNSEQIVNKGFLDPVCNYIVGPIPIPKDLTSCSSLVYTKNYYEVKLEETKLGFSERILEMIEKIYRRENFSKTKEISFLLDKSNSKFSVLETIEKFDNLRIDFLGIDKRRIQCDNIEIDGNEMILSMSCNSFSKGYENNIIGFSGNKADTYIGGTSISIANSFLNYIDKNSINFELINKQKVFVTENLFGEKNGYTMKTPFNIKLKINF